MKRHLIPFLALAAALPLLGCNGQRIVLCPGGAILADTSAEVVFRPGAPMDPSGQVVTGYITNVKTDCIFDRQQGQTFSSLDIDFRAIRAPSPDAASYPMVYFVTINQAERVLGKKLFTVVFNFAPGATATTTTQRLEQQEIELERGHLPTDYQFLTGFQLTADQLAYNRKMSRYIP